MKLIAINDGFLNADRIITVTEPRGKDEPYIIEYETGDGPQLIHTRHFNTDVVADVIPASPGFYVIGCFDDFTVWKTPVVAWRVDDMNATPVIPDSLPRDYAILDPDGQVIEPHNAAYDNLDAYKKAKRKEAEEKRLATAGTGTSH